MTYKYNGKSYTIPDAEIDALVDSLDCSIAEACEAYLFDHDLIESEEEKKMTETAKKNRITHTIHNAKGEKKERKPREKKENPLKKEIISAIYSVISDEITASHCVSIKNDEKYIDFNVGDREFTINLVEHRKKKG